MMTETQTEQMIEILERIAKALEERNERFTSKTTAESSVRTESGLDKGGILPQSPTTPRVHSHEDVPEDRPPADSGGPGRWFR